MSNADYIRQYRAEHPEYVAKAKAWRERPEIKRQIQNTKLQRLYGITIDEWESLLARQNGVCAICKKNHKKMVVDHCHISNKVRGILCDKCNVALGIFKDDKDILSSAIVYLSQN